MTNYQEYWDWVVTNNPTYNERKSSEVMCLLKLLKENGVQSVLDVGCGTGFLYPLVAQNQITYKGVDPSLGMIEVCKKNFPEIANWEVQDAIDLKEEDSSWDAVVLVHSLDYVHDYEKALKEAIRVAGRFVLIILWRGINLNSGNEISVHEPTIKDNLDYKYATGTDFALIPLIETFNRVGLKVKVITNGPDVNAEGRKNILFLLEK